MANTVEIIVRANSAQAEAALRALRGELGNVKVQSQAAGQSAIGLGTNLGSLLSKVALITSAFAILTGAVTKTIGAYISYGNEIDRATKLTGVTAEELQKLRFAVEQEHGSFEDLTQSFRFLSRAMRGTLEDGSDATKLFKVLGVETKNQDGSLRGLNEVWLDLGEAFRGMKDDATRNAIALQLLGRSAFSILPAMMQGREEIKKLGEQARGAGKVLDAEMIRKAERLGDAWSLSKARVQGSMIAIGAGLISLGERVQEGFARWKPYLEVIVDKLTPALRALSQVIFGPLVGAFNALKAVANAVLPILERAVGFIGRITGITGAAESKIAESAAAQQRAGERATVAGTGPDRSAAARRALGAAGKEGAGPTRFQLAMKEIERIREAAEARIEAEEDDELRRMMQRRELLLEVQKRFEAASKNATKKEAEDVKDIRARLGNELVKIDGDIRREQVRIELESIEDTRKIIEERERAEEQARERTKQFIREAEEEEKSKREERLRLEKEMLSQLQSANSEAAESAIRDIDSVSSERIRAIQHQLVLDQQRLDKEVDQEAAVDKRTKLEVEALTRIAAETEVAIQRVQQLIVFYSALGEQGKDAVEKLVRELEKLNRQKQDAARNAEILGNKLPESMRRAHSEARQLTDTIAGAFATMFQDLLTGAASFGDSFTKFFRSIGTSILQIITKMVAETIVKVLGIEEALRGVFGGLRGGLGGGGLGGLGGGGGILALLLGLGGLLFGQGGVVNGKLTPIAMAASGMVTNRPTLAMLSEFNHQEAVVPMKGGKIPIEGGGNMFIMNISAWDTATGMDQLYRHGDFIATIMGSKRRENHPSFRGR